MSVTCLPIDRLNPAFLKVLTHSYLESKRVQVPLLPIQFFCKVSIVWTTENFLLSLGNLQSLEEG